MKNEFIAWDKKRNCFIESNRVAVNGDGEVFIFETLSKVEGYLTEVFDIKILEYSGKHDRNGMKLYKGDIVKVELDESSDRYDKLDLCEKEVIGVVTIRPSVGAKLIVKKVNPKGEMGISKGGTLSIVQSYDIKIGSIYTNPELIAEDGEGIEK